MEIAPRSVLNIPENLEWKVVTLRAIGTRNYLGLSCGYQNDQTLVPKAGSVNLRRWWQGRPTKIGVVLNKNEVEFLVGFSKSCKDDKSLKTDRYFNLKVEISHTYMTLTKYKDGQDTPRSTISLTYREADIFFNLLPEIGLFMGNQSSSRSLEQRQSDALLIRNAIIAYEITRSDPELASFSPPALAKTRYSRKTIAKLIDKSQMKTSEKLTALSNFLKDALAIVHCPADIINELSNTKKLDSDLTPDYVYTMFAKSTISSDEELDLIQSIQFYFSLDLSLM